MSSDEHKHPQLGLSEGTLCIYTWNEAVKQVALTVRENWNPDDDMSDFGDYLISVLHCLQYSGVDMTDKSEFIIDQLKELSQEDRYKVLRHFCRGCNRHLEKEDVCYCEKY